MHGGGKTENDIKTTKCRKILYKYEEGDIISDPDDHAFLLNIFKEHENWETKKDAE